MTDDPLQRNDAHFLKLQGVDNYRDLGGYPTAAGQQTRWGCFFRSGHLANITAHDLEQVAPLNIRTVFDLRRASERSEFPSQWHDVTPPEMISLDIDGNLHAATMDLVQQIMDGVVGYDEVYQHMLGDYRRIPFDYAPLLKTLCQQLAEDAGGVLVHCMAGKDRTGVLVALVLSLLGVERKAIDKDYLLSNIGFDPEGKLQRLAGNYEGKVEDLAAKIAVVRVMARVETDYLDAALKEAGDIELYFLETVGVERETIAALRAQLLA